MSRVSQTYKVLLCLTDHKFDLDMRDKLAKRYKLRVVGFVKDVSNEEIPS